MGFPQPFDALDHGHVLQSNLHDVIVRSAMLMLASVADHFPICQRQGKDRLAHLAVNRVLEQEDLLANLRTTMGFLQHVLGQNNRHVACVIFLDHQGYGFRLGVLRS